MRKTLRRLVVAALCSLAASNACASGGWHRFWGQLDHSAYIQLGNSKTVVYDFFDPKCPYCLDAFVKEMPFVNSGRIAVRFVPVGFLTPSSFGKAAFLLESPNPQAALFSDMRGVSRDDSGGVPALSSPSPGIRAALQHNQELLEQTGSDLVPDLVFRLPDGHVGMIRGDFPPYALQAISRGEMP